MRILVSPKLLIWPGDDRLHALQPDLDPWLGRDATRGDSQRAPEAIGKNLRAAVNAGTLVSFSPD
jgi:hypothetical protein